LVHRSAATLEGIHALVTEGEAPAWDNRIGERDRAVLNVLRPDLYQLGAAATARHARAAL
jgi:hypothetical protein